MHLRCTSLRRTVWSGAIGNRQQQPTVAWHNSKSITPVSTRRNLLACYAGAGAAAAAGTAGYWIPTASSKYLIYFTQKPCSSVHRHYCQPEHVAPRLPPGAHRICSPSVIRVNLPHSIATLVQTLADADAGSIDVHWANSCIDRRCPVPSDFQ